MGSNKEKHMQGEGNYDAARRFNEAEKKFVESGKVGQAARDAEPKNATEEADMKHAEDAGRARAKTKTSGISEKQQDSKRPPADLPRRKKT